MCFHDHLLDGFAPSETDIQACRRLLGTRGPDRHDPDGSVIRTQTSSTPASRPHRPVE
jgi:hypothetical protein